MSDTIIINYPTDEGLTINIDDNDDVIVNIIDEPDIIVYLCDDLGTTANNYDYLDNKPSINNVELVGNKTLDDLGIEQKKGIDDFYLTNAEKTQGALATGNITLDTVKKVADRADRLLVDFTVPIDTASITFDRDKNGVLFSDLDLKSIICIIVTPYSSQSFINSRIRLNNITENYHTTGSSSVDGFIFSLGGIIYNSDIFYVINNTLFYIGRQHRSLDVNLTDGALVNRSGINTNNFNTINNISYSSNNLFLAGSNIKIYRND